MAAAGTFSKTISNGFAMGAVIGTHEAMSDAAASFISTTYHTERIGPVAALACIKKMRECKVQDHNCEMGRLIRDGWCAANPRPATAATTAAASTTRHRRTATKAIRHTQGLTAAAVLRPGSLRLRAQASRSP